MHVQSFCFAYSTYCRFDVLVVVAVVACENIRFSSLFAAEDGDESEEKRMFSQAMTATTTRTSKRQ